MERYGWRFAGHPVSTERRALPIGDYAVLADEACLAVVERKTPADLCSSAVSGVLGLAMMELTSVPRAAVVVEGRLSDVVKAASAARVQPGWILNLIASLQVAHPTVQWMFAETRTLAQDWAYRWLAASSSVTLPADAAPRVQDQRGRRARAITDASNAELTVALHAARSGVTEAQARRDLADLVASGDLLATREGRRLVYRSAAPVPLDAKVTPQ
jgi:ERCC4-type nuclease